MNRINKSLKVFIIVAVSFVTFIIILCCTLPYCAAKIDFSAVFYYVCYACPSDTHSASSMSTVVHSYGGAGYIIENEGKYYVTISCYYEENDARTVCNTLNKKGVDCSVLKVSADDYSIKGSAKKNREKYLGNLNTLLSLSEVCYGLANSMDDYSCNQKNAKSVLEDVSTALDGLARQNSNNCFSEEIASLRAECDDVSYGYIFSYDVRRLQIAVCDSIANLKLY